MHVIDDDLILHYYAELAAGTEAAVSAHLIECPACRDDYRRLQRVLMSVDDAALPGPDLPDAFERVVWARLQPALGTDGASRSGWWARLGLVPIRLGWSAAAVALVIGAFWAGRLTPRGPEAGGTAITSQTRERILLVALGDHLDRSQRVLIELVSADGDGPVDITGERDRAVQLVAANRLYRETAAATGDAAISDLLDQLERVLVDVAASPTQLSATGLEEVRRRIESGSLLFKVRVVSSDLQERRRSTVSRTGQRSSL